MSSGEHARATASHRYDGPIDERLADEAARELREQTDEVLILSTSSGSTGDVRMHVPDGDGTEALCQSMNSWREPRRKPVSCYPPGWHSWCARCAISVVDWLEAPPGIPIQALPERDRDD